MHFGNWYFRNLEFVYVNTINLYLRSNKCLSSGCVHIILKIYVLNRTMAFNHEKRGSNNLWKLKDDTSSTVYAIFEWLTYLN